MNPNQENILVYSVLVLAVMCVIWYLSIYPFMQFSRRIANIANKQLDLMEENGMLEEPYRNMPKHEQTLGEFGGSSNLIGTNAISGGIAACTMHSRDPRCPGISGVRRK